MINLCTLFDANYLTRGLALYQSLNATCPSFHLYVLAFDTPSYDYLRNVKLPNLTPISLQEFEDEKLLEIKPTRSAAEYCWTCTPSVILFCLEKFNLPSCTYVDADMIFYDDPAILLNEMGASSILISEHRYTKEYDNSPTHGIYCVQFMCFKNNQEGLIALKWWRYKCLEWCYARQEDGKFGDQKYLDDWTTRFKGVHVLQHPGGGVAPWNLQQYTFIHINNAIHIKSKKTGQTSPLVFFHYHGLKFYTDNIVAFSGSLYDIDEDSKNKLYFPYVRTLMQIESQLKKEGVRFNVTGARQPAPGRSQVFKNFVVELLVMIWRGKISPLQPKNYNFSRHYHLHQLQSL